jgi:hypothetical protein
MNSQGNEILSPEFEEIVEAYRCGNIKDNLLLLDNKIIARNGSVIFSGKVEEIEELGYGFLH